MKKTSTNRRKKLPLLLGALLIISVAAYGTRAYFSDSATVQGDIELSLGDVDIKAADDSDWTYTPSQEVGDKNNFENTNLTDKDEKKIIKTGVSFSEESIKNVRPGDSFTRTFNITNNGSLDVKMYLESALSSDGSPFVTKIDGMDNGTTLSVGDTENYVLTITVDPVNVDNNYNKKEDKLDLTKKAVNYLDSNLIVKAVQMNADKDVNE